MAGPSITKHEINKVSQMMKDGWDSYQYVEEFEEILLAVAKSMHWILPVQFGLSLQESVNLDHCHQLPLSLEEKLIF